MMSWAVFDFGINESYHLSTGTSQWANDCEWQEYESVVAMNDLSSVVTFWLMSSEQECCDFDTRKHLPCSSYYDDINHVARKIILEQSLQ